ncbi:MAG: restriction endonuclease subunit S [Pseudomonadota bacterium]|nr:restriction endonuclease subunit S [Pseudomonadota bacterium]
MSWPKRELRHCARFMSGGTPYKKNPDFWNGSIPWVSSGEMTEQFIMQTSLSITKEGADAGSKIVPKGTIFAVVRGMSLATEFRISYACREMAFNQDLKALVVKDDIDSYFLFCALRANSKNIRDLSTEAGHGTKKLEMQVLESYEIHIPSIAEQKKAASVIKNYDDLIQTNQQRITLLEEAAQRLYDEWFVKLRFPNHEQVPVVDGVPDGWTLGSVGDFYETSSGGTPSRSNMDYYGGDILWVRTQELNGNYIFETSEKITIDAVKNSSAKIFPENTVLVAMYGVTIGELAILGATASTNQACCAILEKHECSSYIHAFLFFLFNKKGLLNIAQGSAQTNVSQQVIKAFPMMMPPARIMEKFITFCEPHFLLKKELELQNQKLMQARDELLPRLMSGRLDVSRMSADREE